MNERASALWSNDSGGVARYLQLATLFRRNIVGGHWPVGEQIPTVDDLAARHGVARATVRQALGLLEAEQLIERFRAKGTFVRQRPPEQLWYEVETNWSGLLRSREGATIELLFEEKDRQPPQFPGETGERAASYRHLQRRHSRDGQPFLLADVYIEEKICRRIPRKAFAMTPALTMLATLKGLDIAEVRQTLTIGAADPVSAQGLNIPLNAPVAHVHRSAVDSAGQLICVADGTYRGDVVRLDIKLK